MNTATQHLETVPHLATSLRVPFGRVAQAIDKLELRPAVTIDGVAYFDVDQCNKIAAQVKPNHE